MTMGVVVMGIPAGQARIAQVRGALLAGAAPAARAGAMVVEAEAKARVQAWPAILSGELLDSIEVVDGESGGATGSSSDVEAGAEHAVFVEMGTSDMAAQPFLRPAIDENEDATVAAVAAVLRAAIAPFGG